MLSFSACSCEELAQPIHELSQHLFLFALHASMYHPFYSSTLCTSIPQTSCAPTSLGVMGSLRFARVFLHVPVFYTHVPAYVHMILCLFCGEAGCSSSTENCNQLHTFKTRVDQRCETSMLRSVASHHAVMFGRFMSVLVQQIFFICTVSMSSQKKTEHNTSR